jgi:hypothetical protein
MKHLDRRGGSRPSEAKVWRRGGRFFILIPPPRLVRFATLIGLGTPPVQEGILVTCSSEFLTFLFERR